MYFSYCYHCQFLHDPRYRIPLDVHTHGTSRGYGERGVHIRGYLKGSSRLLS